jgi:predicted amidohydrolase YtcJ
MNGKGMQRLALALGFAAVIAGSITPGKLADVVVLSKGILKIPDAEIPTPKVVLTILGGQVRWRSEP